LLTAAIQATAAAISCDTAALLARMLWRAAGGNLADPLPVIDPGLGRILRFGTQIDTRAIRHDTGGLPGTGTALSAQAVANYIAKYATKTTGAPGLPHRPVPGPAAIGRLRASSHHKQLITTCWELGKDPAASQLALNRWTHMLGYRGHFLTKSRRYSVTFTQLRQAVSPTAACNGTPTARKTPGVANSTTASFWSSPPGSTREPATPPLASTSSRSPPPHVHASTTGSHERKPG
jgi:hypothetical protein